MPEAITQTARCGLCVSCGACFAVAPGALRWQRHADGRAPTPLWQESPPTALAATAWTVCPGKGVDFKSLAREFIDTTASHHPDLGHWNGMWAAHSASADVIEHASSGGVMTEIAAHLLENGLVNGVVTTRMTYGSPGPRPETFIARSRAELLAAQGSKYCPVPAVAALADPGALPGPVAFIGTPCQIAAVRMIQRVRPEWKERVPYTIGNFCGGFRDFREMHRLIRKYGLAPERVVRFRYRGGGQPGSLLIEDDAGRVVTRPYPDYVRETGYTKLRRCLLCVDATAELADFSCGDAWLDRFMHDANPWSIVMTRTCAARKILEDLDRLGVITTAALSPDEVRHSQRINLTSKKHRQHARRRLYRWMGRQVPEYNGGFSRHGGSLLFEAFVTFCHHVSERAETGSPFHSLLLGMARLAKVPLKRLRGTLRAFRLHPNQSGNEGDKKIHE